MGYPSHAQKAATAPTAPGVCENMRKKNRKMFFDFPKQYAVFFWTNKCQVSTPGLSGTETPTKSSKSKIVHFLSP